MYDILEEAGFEVYLVNARDTKNLPGEKTDVEESPWLMKLPTSGLLRNSFRPPQEIRGLRTYWRQRNDLVQSPGPHLQRMRKVLTPMNPRLANLTSDLSGATGQAIVKAILKGGRDPHALAALHDVRVKARAEQIARGPEGKWQEDLLFVLPSEQGGYEFCLKQMTECDQRLEQYRNQRPDRRTGDGLPEENRKGWRGRKKGKAPPSGLREALFRTTGVDLTGIDVMTAATVISQAGRGMSQRPTERHFACRLRLCPDNKISGDGLIGKGHLPTTHRLTQPFKIATGTLLRSNSYLGSPFRSL